MDGVELDFRLCGNDAPAARRYDEEGGIYRLSDRLETCRGGDEILHFVQDDTTGSDACPTGDTALVLSHLSRSL
jgi:hypothetical protein